MSKGRTAFGGAASDIRRFWGSSDSRQRHQFMQLWHKITHPPITCLEDTKFGNGSCLWVSQRQLVGSFGKQDAALCGPLTWSSWAFCISKGQIQCGCCRCQSCPTPGLYPPSSLPYHHTVPLTPHSACSLSFSTLSSSNSLLHLVFMDFPVCSRLLWSLHHWAWTMHQQRLLCNCWNSVSAIELERTLIWLYVTWIHMLIVCVPFSPLKDMTQREHSNSALSFCTSNQERPASLSFSQPINFLQLVFVSLTFQTLINLLFASLWQRREMAYSTEGITCDNQCLLHAIDLIWVGCSHPHKAVKGPSWFILSLLSNVA